MPKRSENKVKLLMGHVFDRETQRLKSELKRISKALLKSTVDNSSMVDGISRGECILELVSLSIDAAGVVCDAPVLNFLKPIVGIAAMICDTAKSVKSNHEAALGLAKHSSVVTKCLVDYAATHDVSAASNDEALVVLKSALGDIQSYFAALQKPRHRLASWIIVNHEKDRTVQLNRALDEALALFTVRHSVFAVP
ncbi:hypothetical protein B0H14DRAFT_371022 [Mycena olivaceomarginata]|nr:hypothetical protein B0H14DRAFT_371022 [Mycena olivaceomarginata]